MNKQLKFVVKSKTNIFWGSDLEFIKEESLIRFLEFYQNVEIFMEF